MPEPQRSPSDRECLDKARACRALARSMHDPSHRAMLEQMADTWERLAETVRASPQRGQATSLSGAQPSVSR